MTPSPDLRESRVEPDNDRGTSNSSVALHLDIRSARVGRYLFAIALGLSLIDFVLQTIHFTIDPPIPKWEQLVNLFDMDREGSLPTWYSIVLLLVASILFALLAWADHKRKSMVWRYWAGLSVVFLGLSIDDQVGVHETLSGTVGSQLSGVLGDQVEVGGIFYYAWILPAAILVLFLGIALIPFLRELPARTRNGMVVSGVLFLCGALGLEMVSGVLVDDSGTDNLRFETVTTIEETLELIGVSYLLVLLISEAGSRLRHVAVTLDQA